MNGITRVERLMNLYSALLWILRHDPSDIGFCDIDKNVSTHENVELDTYIQSDI
jgi:hypothetical protein